MKNLDLSELLGFTGNPSGPEVIARITGLVDEFKQTGDPTLRVRLRKVRHAIGDFDTRRLIGRAISKKTAVIY